MLQLIPNYLIGAGVLTMWSIDHAGKAPVSIRKMYGVRVCVRAPRVLRNGEHGCWGTGPRPPAPPARWIRALPPPLIGPEIEMKNFVIPVVCICFWTMFVHFPLLHHPQSRTTCLRVPVVAISLQFFAIFAMSLKKSKLCYDSTFFASIRFIFSNVNPFIFRLLWTF